MVRFGRRSLTVLAVALLVVCLVVGSVDADGKSHREMEGLVGPVRVAVEEVADYSQKFGEWTEGPRRKTIYHFTPSGYFTELLFYDENGVLWHRMTFDYNEKGNLIKRTDSIGFVELYAYDESNNNIEAVLYFAGKARSRWEYKYDIGGNKVEEAKYESDGSLSEKTIFKYDEVGNVVEEFLYKADGSLWLKFRFKYDAAGNRIEMATYDLGGLSGRHTYKRDRTGNIIEEEETQYDASGPVTEKRRYEYEFDSHGNWTKQVCFRWVTRFGESYWEPQRVTYRTITYY